MATWLTAEQFLLGFPETMAGEFLSPDGRILSTEEILESETLDELLTRAMGRVEAALLSSHRYTADDLDGLTGAAAAYLRQIGSEVCAELLVRTRPGLHVEFAKGIREQAAQSLQDIRDGKDLLTLGDGSVEDAATPDTTLVTAVDYTQLNTLGDQLGGKYPSRYDRLPRQKVT